MVASVVGVGGHGGDQNCSQALGASLAATGFFKAGRSVAFAAPGFSERTGGAMSIVRFCMAAAGLLTALRSSGLKTPTTSDSLPACSCMDCAAAAASST